jgi:hypothetical protein
MMRFPWNLSRASGRKRAARSVPSRKQRRVQLAVEALEERLVPSSTPNFLPPPVGTLPQYSFSLNSLNPSTGPFVEGGLATVAVSEVDSTGAVVSSGGVPSATVTWSEFGTTLFNESIPLTNGSGRANLPLNDPGTVTIEASYAVNTGYGIRAVTISGQTSIVVTAPAVSSPNWSGYVVKSAQGGTTAVGGTWVQPAVSGTNGEQAAMWVGIDGAGNNTVEQIGTYARVVNGQTQVTPWYEFYGDQGPDGVQGPAFGSQSIGSSIVVHPGDTISAEVVFLHNSISYNYNPNLHRLTPSATSTFLFQMTDVPAGGGAVETWSSQETTSYIQPARTSAEWIIEPGANSDGSPISLANFGTATFTGAWATIGGTTGAINNFSNVQELNIVQGLRNSLVQDNPPNYSTSPGFNEPATNLGSSSFSLHWQINFPPNAVAGTGGSTTNGGANPTAGAMVAVFGVPAGVTPSNTGAGPLDKEQVPAAALAQALQSFLPTSHRTLADHGGRTIAASDDFWADLGDPASFDAHSDGGTGVMSAALAPGVRNLPTPADVAAAFASGRL